MKRVLIAIATTMVASSAMATNSNNSDTYNTYDQRNYGGNTTNQGGLGGNGGAGGQGGAGGSASASAGAAAIAAQGQQQGQQQSQGQGQSQSSNSNSSVKNSGNSSSSSGVKNSGNSANLNSNVSNSGGNTQSNAGNNASTNVSVGGDTYQAARIPVSTAYAPNIAPTAPCMGSTSGGVQSSVVGISVGSTWVDTNCQLLEQVRTVATVIGDRETAAEMMQAVPAYADAKKRIADRKNGTTATATGTSIETASKASAKGDYTDPIIRARLGLPPLSK